MANTYSSRLAICVVLIPQILGFYLESRIGNDGESLLGNLKNEYELKSYDSSDLASKKLDLQSFEFFKEFRHPKSHFQRNGPEKRFGRGEHMKPTNGKMATAIFGIMPPMGMGIMMPPMSMEGMAPSMNMGEVTSQMGMGGMMPPMGMGGMTSQMGMRGMMPPMGIGGMMSPMGMGGMMPPMGMGGMMPPMGMGGMMPPMGMGGMKQPRKFPPAEKAEASPMKPSPRSLQNDMF